MRRLNRSLFYLFVFILSSSVLHAQFTPGNLVALQAEASANNTTCSVIEFNATSAGQSAVTTTVIDGTGANALRFSGSATSTGYLANSADRSLVCFTGANNINTGSNVNTLNPRGVGTLNATRSFSLATTYTGSSGDQTRCATTLNNSNWYIADQGGLFTNGTSAASPSGNFRSVKPFGGLVYGFQASAIGTLSAASGGAFTALPGVTVTSGQDFYLVSSGANGSSFDILYIISATGNTAGTISKYSLVGATWTSNGTFTTNFGGFGMAAQTGGSGAYLYISTGLGALTANSVLRVTDAAGYNTAISITAANNITLYTAPAGRILKGVAFAPVTPATSVNLSVSTNAATETDATVVTVTATTSAAVTGDQTVSLGVSGTGITAGDYTLSNATITIPNGSTTGTVTFTIVDDADVEGPETATLTISNPSSGLVLGSTIAQNITIADNDAPPAPTVNLSVSANSGTEAAATVITVTATASAAVTGDQTITIGVSGTNITAGDYSLSNTTITIPNGSTTGSVTFTITDDVLVEGTETAVLTISNPSAGIVLGSTLVQNISITDNDLPLMRITEYMYDGVDGEFIEFTNVGAVPINMTGWSFDDADRVPGAVNLSAFGTVKPGESVILTQSTAAAFRTSWNLCSNVKVIGGNTNNLGRADEINLYDGSNNLIDRFTYNDQTLGGPRTQNASGWVSAAGLGNNIATQWSLSIVADAEGSYAAAGGNIGNPGKSNRATVVYNPCPPGTMRITEYQYNGSEFIEFTNVGTTSVDMTGWSFDDASRTAGSQSLSALGIVEAGESVILSEASATSFRATWGICDGIKVIGGNTQNLGRADEINIYDASSTLIDRLTYDDQTLGGPRTDLSSAWVSETGMGANLHNQWTLSTVADAEGSILSATGNFAGSPGRSTRAIVLRDPCPVLVGAPVIVVDVATTTNALDGGVLVSPVSPYSASGVISDPSDPAATSGFAFTISDDATPVGSLVVTAASSNTTVVPNVNLVLSGTSASRTLTITPAAVGYSIITVTVNDGTQSTNYIINYAASAGSATTSWMTGIADASSAIALDDDYMVVVNDETNFLYVYNRHNDGLPVKRYDFNPGNILGVSDEVDLEAGVRSIANPSKIFWLGSMSNSSNSPFASRPERNRLFAVTVSGTAADPSFAYAGHYSNLRDPLIAWGDANGYAFTASAAANKDPKLIDGFNAEGMVFAPDNTTLYIGFRAPLVPTATRTNAVIAPVLNFETWFNNGSPAGIPSFGAPIELNLGGRGIREIIRLSNGTYVIVAGSYGEASNPAIYRWTGNAADAPVHLPSFDLTGLNAEAVLPINEGGNLSLNKLQIISDNGDMVYYNDGTAAKDLPDDNFRKFSSDVVVSASIVLPLELEYFTATKRGTDVVLNWKVASQDDGVLFEVLRSVNGRDFNLIQTVAVVNGQQLYSFTDMNVQGTKVYYRIATKNISGQKQYSAIRSISMNGVADIVKMYPNPVVNNIFSVVTSKPGVKQLQVYNSAGVLHRSYVFAENAKDVNTSGWARGYYLVRFVAEDGTVLTQQVAVQ